MNNVGIWIDHRKAVIVSASADRVTVKTLESTVGPHSRYSGRAGSPMPEGGPQDEGGEKKYEERYGQHLDQYYDEVIGQLGQPEALLILGPGEAKLQLKERLSRLQGAVRVHRENRDRGQVDRSADRREGEGALRARSLRND